MVARAEAATMTVVQCTAAITLNAFTKAKMFGYSKGC